MINKSVIISILLILPLQTTLSQINDLEGDELENNTNVTTEDVLVVEKL